MRKRRTMKLVKNRCRKRLAEFYSLPHLLSLATTELQVDISLLVGEEDRPQFYIEHFNRKFKFFLKCVVIFFGLKDCVLRIVSNINLVMFKIRHHILINCNYLISFLGK